MQRYLVCHEDLYSNKFTANNGISSEPYSYVAHLLYNMTAVSLVFTDHLISNESDKTIILL